MPVREQDVWSPEFHRYYLADFRLAVETLLLCHQRLHGDVSNDGVTLGILPHDVLLLVVEHLASVW
jgi:hypothetical protein